MTDTDSERVLVPGRRTVHATLDAPETDACVVACPPHPQMGGRRTDTRLVAVSEALAPAVATLRFDYGPWDEGGGELADARNAFGWARDRYDAVALFGYSFGGCVALLAAARESVEGEPPAAVAALAPASQLGAELDAAAELDAVGCPGYVLYGERDTTVECEPVVERARALGHPARRAAEDAGERRDQGSWCVESMSADHHFVGQSKTVGEKCGSFLREALCE